MNALEIIELLAQNNNHPQRLLDIANQLGMNTSTALRYLGALNNCGYVQQDEDTQRYSLTMKICAIANKVIANNDLCTVARPVMKRLSYEVQESVCLAIEQDFSVIYAAVEQGPDQMFKTMQRIGSSAPMHCTGIGKVLLCYGSEEKVDKMIQRKGLPIFTANTLHTREDLLEVLKKVRAEGVGFDNEECELGARCIAVPIFDYRKRVVAGLSITGTIFRMTDEALKRMLPILKSSAAEISNKLGYSDSQEQ